MKHFLELKLCSCAEIRVRAIIWGFRLCYWQKKWPHLIREESSRARSEAIADAQGLDRHSSVKVKSQVLGSSTALLQVVVGINLGKVSNCPVSREVRPDVGERLCRAFSHAAQLNRDQSSNLTAKPGFVVLLFRDHAVERN